MDFTDSNVSAMDADSFLIIVRTPIKLSVAIIDYYFIRFKLKIREYLMDFRTAELRTAIIYTGEIRTIQKCIYNFKQMVVAGNTHVHAVLQCPPSKEKKTEITQLLFDVLGCHLHP